MKKLFCFLIFLAGSFLLAQEKTDLEQAGLKGKVKSVRKYMAFGNADEEIASESLKLQSETFYNREGNATEQIQYRLRDHSFAYKNTSVYAPGQKTVYQTTSPDAETFIKEFTFKGFHPKPTGEQYGTPDPPPGKGNATVYNYDKEGRIIKITAYNQDGYRSRVTEYIYDAKGNKTNETEYNQYGEKQSEQYYKYDDKGNITELKALVEGKYIGKAEMEYDLHGNEVKGTQYGPGGTVTIERTYKREYDAAGNQTSYSYYKGNMLNHRKEMKYNADDILTEEATYGADGKLIEKTIFKYSNGLLQERLMYKTDEVLYSRVVYSYDEKGNQPESTSYNYARNPTKTVNRTEIVYY